MAQIISNEHVCGVVVDDRNVDNFVGTWGVYAIVHLPTGRRYVGQTTCVATRRLTHLRDLSLNRHPCAPLQRVWDVTRPGEWVVVMTAAADVRWALLDAEEAAFRAAGPLLINKATRQRRPEPNSKEITEWHHEIAKSGRVRGSLGLPGGWVRAAREVMGLSQERLAWRIGVVTRCVSLWERCRVDERSYYAMLKILGLPSDFAPYPDPWAESVARMKREREERLAADAKRTASLSCG